MKLRPLETVLSIYLSMKLRPLETVQSIYILIKSVYVTHIAVTIQLNV
jgi:hypothetical protein